MHSDPALASVIRESAPGHVVRHVVDHDAVLAAAQSELPLAIVLSADMERGYALCRRLKKDAVAARARLVLTSGRATEQEFLDHARLPTRADAYVRGSPTASAFASALGLPEPALSAPFGGDEPTPADVFTSVTSGASGRAASVRAHSPAVRASETLPEPNPAALEAERLDHPSLDAFDVKGDPSPPVPFGATELEFEDSVFDSLDAPPIPIETRVGPGPRTGGRSGSWDLGREVNFAGDADSAHLWELEGALGTDPGLAAAELPPSLRNLRPHDRPRAAASDSDPVAVPGSRGPGAVASWAVASWAIVPEAAPPDMAPDLEHGGLEADDPFDLGPAEAEVDATPVDIAPFELALSQALARISALETTVASRDAALVELERAHDGLLAQVESFSRQLSSAVAAARQRTAPPA